MDERQKTDLLRITRKAVAFDAPMASFTTFRVGGPADALCEVADLETLRRILPFLAGEGIPYLVIGRGSNLLVRDLGIRGAVIRLSGDLDRIHFAGADGCHVLAGGGLSMVDLLIGCRRRGLSGLEFLAGIPGTVGGGVAMNAGAFGEDTAGRVRETVWVDRRGQVHTSDRSGLRFSYRSLSMEEGSVIAQAGFLLTPGTEKQVARQMAEYLRRRKASQPLGQASAGSVFRNPPDDYAGRLIEEAGLKGKQIGGAVISTRHANFVVNQGGATAADILALIRAVRETVMKTAGIALELEIRVVGEGN
jgi:UDP-N-acetylmuramate dehydrogenase